jgi:hypothetical protein
VKEKCLGVSPPPVGGVVGDAQNLRYFSERQSGEVSQLHKLRLACIFCGQLIQGIVQSEQVLTPRQRKAERPYTDSSPPELLQRVAVPSASFAGEALLGSGTSLVDRLDGDAELLGNLTRGEAVEALEHHENAAFG